MRIPVGLVTVALALSGAASAAAAPGAYVRLDQAGFRPSDAKRALLLAPVTARTATFRVLDARDRIVLTGGAGADLGAWSAAFPHAHALDLTGLRRSGAYHVIVAGPVTATSPAFRVAPGQALYAPLLANAVAYYTSVRDGADVDPSVLRRRPAHLTDRRAAIFAPPRYRDDRLLSLRPLGGSVNVAGGWFDAGDYVKFVETTSYVEAVMLVALRDHASRYAPAARQRLRQEARRGITWLSRMWDDRRRVLYYQVGIGDGNDRVYADHDVWRLPQADDALSVRRGGLRYYVKYRPVFRAGPPGAQVSPNLAGRLSADFALCAQVFRDLAARCRTWATHVFESARTRRVTSLLTASPHDYYPETQWRDDLVLGAAELARVARGSSRSRWLRLARTWASLYRTSPRESDTLNLYDVGALAEAELARQLPAGTAARNAAIGDLARQLAGAEQRGRRDPFRFGIAYGGGDATPHALGLAVTAALYHGLTGRGRYDALGQAQLDWALGANAWGSSFVVGAGTVFPHCMQSQIANLAGSLDGRPPLQLGAVVDGPNERDAFQDLGLPDGARACPARPAATFAAFDARGVRYLDDARAWPSVEPTLDYTVLTLLAFAERAA